MRIIDAGCGYGSITLGLAAAVSPAEVIGIDIDDQAIADATSRAKRKCVANVRFEAANVSHLPFPDESFDAAFAHALLQHVDSSIVVLRELRRVLKTSGVIGVADAEFDGAIIAPSNDALAESWELLKRTRRNPHIGKELRGLLHEAGFTNVQATATAVSRGTDQQTKLDGYFWASYFEARPLSSSSNPRAGPPLIECEKSPPPGATGPTTRPPSPPQSGARRQPGHQRRPTLDPHRLTADNSREPVRSPASRDPNPFNPEESLCLRR